MRAKKVVDNYFVGTKQKVYILNEENKNRNKKIGKIIGKILLVEFALCFVWAIFIANNNFNHISIFFY